MGDTPFIVKSHDVRLDAEYSEWLQDIKRRYRSAQLKAAVKVNAEQLLFNWNLGRDLVVRKAEEKWGNGIVEQVSLDLQDAFPGVKGFSTSNLWYMKKWYQFYAEHTNFEKLQQLVGVFAQGLSDNQEKLQQIGTAVSEDHIKLHGEMPFLPIFSYIPWGHHIVIITKCKTIEEAVFYLCKIIEEGWSRKALDDCIRSDLYHTSGQAVTNFQEQLPLPQGKLALELTKGNYDLGFLSLPKGYDEKELETAIEHHMTRFLLELGNGWAFVGRQKEIVVAGKTRKIDLLFFHIHYRFYMVVELKVKPFEPEFAGKLNFYVNAVNELIRTPNENPTIGLLICRDMNRTEVQWALQGISTPIGVATYDNVKLEDIQAQLPTVDEINQCVERAEKEYLQRRNEPRQFDVE